MFVDTAGQECFNAIAPILYHKADFFMLVYDITNRSSFESLIKWLNDIDNHKGKMKTDAIQIMLIGNKADMDNRTVSYEEGMKFATERQMSFFETSAKTGANIMQAFECIIKELVESVRLQDAFRNFQRSANVTGTTTVQHTRHCCSSSASTPQQPNLTFSLQTTNSSPNRSGSYAATSSTDTIRESPSIPCEFTLIFMHISYSRLHTENLATRGKLRLSKT